ncbi:MAG: YidC/Oxa1 family membrane protein insertase [Candidatus Pacebacteria bacterium]|jgi:YidC/Oxa1 family membrane protein insertase|nr:YidC/Oxa1 family membrane protein insertase [Candidatus Paceibacterota bacterium]
MNIFDALLYQPFFNILILFYEYLPGRDFGVAIIALTVLIRFLLYPLVAESIRVQKVNAVIQPKIKEIQEKYKDNKEKQAMLMMELWKEHKINPLSTLLFLLIQIPILWTLYRVFWDGFKNESLANLYPFVPNPGTVNPVFLGVINLSEARPELAVAAGILQFIQVKMMIPKTAPATGPKSQSEQFAAMMQTQSLYVFPLITILIFWGLPSALGLYWVATSVFSIVQQYLILKKDPADGGKGKSLSAPAASGI